VVAELHLLLVYPSNLSKSSKKSRSVEGMLEIIYEFTHPNIIAIQACGPSMNVLLLFCIY
jgi:hypothetical protein